MKGVIKYNNEELVKGVRDKDNDVLLYIIKRSSKPVKEFVLRNSGSEQDADDILQEAIIVLFRKMSDEKFKLTSTISTFIYSIARLTWLKELERRKIRHYESYENNDVIDDEDSISFTIEKNEKLRLYREKFEELKEDCKKILRLFYLGSPMSQITSFMGYSSDDYTKKRKYKCKNALIEKIKTSNEYKELGYGNKYKNREIS